MGRHGISRRDFLKCWLGALGTAAAAGGIATFLTLSRTRAKSRSSGGSFKFTPFTADLPIPPLAQPVPPFIRKSACRLDPQWGEPLYFEIHMQKAVHQFIPGVDTEVWAYDGMVPGPTFRGRRGQPYVVRFVNDLPDTDTLIHNHGGHQDSRADGSPVDFGFIRPGEYRDFCYPHIAPINPDTGEQELSDFASTQWYHDHRADVTGRNVYMGLTGFYLLTDELERDLIESGRLPTEGFDVPLVFQDKLLAPDGSLIYNPEEDDFDGVIGNVFTVNGKAQPKFNVSRRKYRFRFLNASTARIYQFRLSSGQFLQIGSDTWLLERAAVPGDGGIPNTIILGPAKRADVIIDFRNAPREVFLENILEQEDGRGPKRVLRRGTPLVKFIVDQSDTPEDNATIAPGDILRPHTRIRPDEIVRTRRFEFERGGGMWLINGRGFDPNRDDANPRLNTAERWILKNGGGGWFHPIHIHLEASQIQRLKQRPLDAGETAKVDTIRLVPNEEAEIFIKFRTFPGRYVFHCHNTEHEDRMMMGVMNVRA